MPWLAARLGGLAPQVPAVTMRLPPSRVMSLDASEIDWAVRLCAQLKTLSEVTESLTFRILELEERFAEQVKQRDQRLPAPDQPPGDLSDTKPTRWPNGVQV